ncbi:MAG: AGE family epimerase/isomerase [Acidobacteriota bacterium]
MTLAAYANFYRDHLANSVLPFWLEHTPDREHGGYFSCVDRQGQVYDPRKYVWMQGRAVWMFETLYRRFAARSEYAEFAANVFGFVDRFARRGEPRVWFSLGRDGAPGYFQRKPYSAVFVALAYISQWRVAEARELFDRIAGWIAEPGSLGRPPGPVSQLADIMVLALLAMELLAVDEDPRYRLVIAQCQEAVWAHYEPANWLLVENVAPRELPEGRMVCPGSILEVAWFLLHTTERVPNAELEGMLLRVILGALEFGWDGEYGGLNYFMDLDGRPRPELEANMKLWWPHTEALYALVLAYTRTGDERYKQWLDRVHEYTFSTFPDSKYGEWFGYCDRGGRVATEMKGGAYKCCFHVPRALLYSILAIERSG